MSNQSTSCTVSVHSRRQTYVERFRIVSSATSRRKAVRTPRAQLEGIYLERPATAKELSTRLDAFREGSLLSSNLRHPILSDQGQR
jgi:hypothetical protein